ncbi:hypothetical protein [Xenorhabdus nematophila]|nr:hypothetical protein [Xenorhabdus nematophila]
MEKTGLIVFPSDGGKHFLLNEECKLLTKLTTIKQRQDGRAWNKYQYRHFVPRGLGSNGTVNVVKQSF